MTVKTRKTNANEAYARLASTAASVRALTETRIADWTPAGTTYDNIGFYLADLLAKYTEMGDLLSTPNLEQAAKDIEDNQAYSITTEIGTLRTLMVAVKDRILADVPKDGNNFRLVLKFNADGSNNWLAFGAVAMTNLLADMQAVVNQVDAS